MKVATLFLLCCGVAMGQTGKVTLVVPTQMPDCCYRIYDREITLVGPEDWPDVPAVQSIYPSCVEWGECFDKDGHVLDACICKRYETHHTCTDKSRILLTAENGSRWCHKIQAGPEPVAKQLGGNALPERDWQVLGDPPDAPSHHPTDDLKWPIDNVGAVSNDCWGHSGHAEKERNCDEPKPKRNWAHEFGRIE